MSTDLSRRLFLSLMGAASASAMIPLPKAAAEMMAAPPVEVAAQPGEVQAFWKGAWRTIGGVLDIHDHQNEVVFESFGRPGAQRKMKGARDVSLTVDVSDLGLAAEIYNDPASVPVRVFSSCENDPLIGPLGLPVHSWFSMSAALGMSMKRAVGNCNEPMRTTLMLASCGPVAMTSGLEPPAYAPDPQA